MKGSSWPSKVGAGHEAKQTSRKNTSYPVKLELFLQIGMILRNTFNVGDQSKIPSPGNAIEAFPHNGENTDASMYILTLMPIRSIQAKSVLRREGSLSTN